MREISKKVLLSAVAATTLILPFTTAHAADATSFDPTLVKVTAKPVSSIPVGTIIAWPVAQNPADWQNPDGTFNWLECNGQSISQTAYPELFALMGGQVPDLRGLFLRGHGSQSHAQNNGSTVGVTSTTHSSGALGQVQGDATRKIWGNGLHHFSSGVAGAFSSYQYASSSGNMSDISSMTAIDSSRVVPTADEIRPVNQAVRYLVRALP